MPGCAMRSCRRLRSSGSFSDAAILVKMATCAILDASRAQTLTVGVTPTPSQFVLVSGLIVRPKGTNSEKFGDSRLSSPWWRHRRSRRDVTEKARQARQSQPQKTRLRAGSY